MLNKLRIAVLAGGPSAEHEVSLKTGAMVFKHLDRKKYIPTLIKISKKGKWPISFQNLKKECDIVFIALHGEYGEDGTVQRLLDHAHIPYTGSGARASALGMDKIVSTRLFQKKGLFIPPYVVIPKDKIRLLSDRTIDVYLGSGLPGVVKPADRGSSVGVSIVREKTKLAIAVRHAFTFSKNIIIQRYIEGTEVTCGVIEAKGKPVALPPTEIVPKGGTFFDYKAKYESEGSDEITPARLPKIVLKKIQRASLAAHRAINARGYSRTDMILEAAKGKSQSAKIYVLEINTLPGLTNASLLPKAAQAMGISFPKLLDYIIESGFSRRKNNR